MYRVEARLAAWKKLYLELGEAHLRLNNARAQSPGGPAVERLVAEVMRLNIESDAALAAVHAEMARIKTTVTLAPAGRAEPLGPD